MYLTGSPWRWPTVSCGYLSRWYGVRQWEGGRVTGPRRYRLALPHSNRWDYARCCSLIDDVVVGRSIEPTIRRRSGCRDGDDGRRWRFDRANRAFWSTVRVRMSEIAGRCRPRKEINKDQQRLGKYWQNTDRSSGRSSSTEVNERRRTLDSNNNNNNNNNNNKNNNNIVENTISANSFWHLAVFFFFFFAGFNVVWNEEPGLV